MLVRANLGLGLGWGELTLLVRARRIAAMIWCNSASRAAWRAHIGLQPPSHRVAASIT